MAVKADNSGWRSWRRRLAEAAAGPMIFTGAVAAEVPSLFRRRGLRRREIFYYLDLCGVRSLPIVIMISLLMGLVVGYQAAVQMRKVGTEIFIVDLVGFSVLKEFGPLMVAVIATGRAGSAFAAEIGSMRADEQISALETLGIVPESYLVLPKLIAMLIAMPVLAVFADAAGIAGGMAVGVFELGLPFPACWGRLLEVLDCTTLLLGILKCVPFAVLITFAGCYCGFSTSGDALGVGRGATRAVVMSVFLVVVADAVITILYSFIGY